MSDDASGIGIPLIPAWNSTGLAEADASESPLSIGIRLKLIRNAFGFSQRELAKRTGVTNSSISMIEQGQVSPSVQSLSRILAAFPISLADFFDFKLSIDNDVYSLDKPTTQRSLVNPQYQQLDARIEHLSAGQATAFGVQAVDSCGVVFDGKVQLTLLSGNRLLTTGDSFYIPANQLFRLINVSPHSASLFRCSLFVQQG